MAFKYEVGYVLLDAHLGPYIILDRRLDKKSQFYQYRIKFLDGSQLVTPSYLVEEDLLLSTTELERLLYGF